MRIWFRKDGGAENESNQVVILAINLRLRNRWSPGVRDIGVNMCEVSFFGSIIRAYYYVRIASAILKEDRTHARFPRRVGTTAQHPLPGNAAAARLSQRIDHRYQRPLWQALLSLPSAPSTRTWS